MTRVLATDSPDVEVWDLTKPATGGPIIQSGDLKGSIPVAVAMSEARDIFVLTQANLQVFDANENHAEGLAVLDVAPLSGVAYAPQDGGPPLVVVCGGGVEAYAFDGLSGFDGGYTSPTPVYSFFRGDFLQCVAGPTGTILAAYSDPGLNGHNDGGVMWFDSATGDAHGNGTFARSQGGVSGVALAAGGEVIMVGDDAANSGFAALLDPAGNCLMARSGGPCAITCGACIASDTTLAGTPLNQVTAMGDGTFLATIRNQDASLASSNKILRLDGKNGLRPTVYYQGIDVFSGGPQFLGILAWPTAPTP